MGLKIWLGSLDQLRKQFKFSFMTKIQLCIIGQQKYICHNMFQKRILRFDYDNNEGKRKSSGKLNEIQILKREVDLYTLSSRLQTLNKQQPCKECIRKDQQIETLIKALKALRSTVANSRQSLKKFDEGIEEEPSRVSHFAKSSEPFQLSQGQFLIDRKTGEGTLNNGSGKKEVNFGIEILKLQSQNKVFLQQIQGLRKKLQLCQKKAFILQQTNKSLRRSYQTNNPNKNILQNLSINKKEATVVEQISNDDIKKRLPTFSSMRANVTKQAVIPAPVSRHAITPRSNILEQTLTSRNFQRMNGFSTTRYRSREGDLIEQRKRSLDHKIKILQVENHKLRKQVYRSIC